MQLEIKELARIPAIPAVLLSATPRCLTNPCSGHCGKHWQRIAKPVKISAYLKKKTEKSD